MPIYYFPNGEPTRHPPSREQAERARDKLYDAGYWCDACNSTRYRHTHNDVCMFCARDTAHQFFNIAVGAIRFEDAKPEARDLWETYGPAIKSGEYGIVPDPCKKAGHVGLRYMQNACLLCRKEREESPNKDARATVNTILMRECPDLILSIEEARAMGYSVYRTGKACARGHKGYRYVASRNCVECIKGGRT